MAESEAYFAASPSVTMPSCRSPRGRMRGEHWRPPPGDVCPAERAPAQFTEQPRVSGYDDDLVFALATRRVFGGASPYLRRAAGGSGRRCPASPVALGG